MENTGIKLLLTFIIAQTIFIALLVQFNIVNISVGKQQYSNVQDPFLNRLEKAPYISALKYSLPAYYEQLSKTDLTDSQRQSLELLYLPVINEFLTTGDLLLIDKANTIKDLVLKGTLSAEPK